MTNWLKLWRAVMQFSPGGAVAVLETYLTVHRNKLGMHWLYAAAGRIAAGENERAVLADYGYERAESDWEDCECLAVAGSEVPKNEKSAWAIHDCEWCNGEGFVVIAEQFERERTL